MTSERERGISDADAIIRSAAANSDPLERFAAEWRQCLSNGGLFGTARQQARFARVDSVQGLLAGYDCDQDRIDTLSRLARGELTNTEE
jgi:hypothetical protein